MMSAKKLLKMAKKWQREARKSANSKGHFVVYTMDGKRFVIPLVHLKSDIFRELFKMSEDEFGLPKDGPIMIPCDQNLMNYLVSVVQKGVCTDLETALFVNDAYNRCSSSSSQIPKQSLVCGY